MIRIRIEVVEVAVLEKVIMCILVLICSWMNYHKIIFFRCAIVKNFIEY